MMSTRNEGDEGRGTMARLAWCCMQMRHIALIIPALSSRWAGLTSRWVRTGFALGVRWVLLVNIACAMKISTTIFTATKNLRQKISANWCRQRCWEEEQISWTDIYENIRTSSDAGK